jgi:hypothetical protein
MLTRKQINSRVYRMFKRVRQQLETANVPYWKPTRKRWMACGVDTHAGWNIKVVFEVGMVPVLSMFISNPHTFQTEYFGHTYPRSFDAGVKRLIELYTVQPGQR